MQEETNQFRTILSEKTIKNQGIIINLAMTSNEHNLEMIKQGHLTLKVHTGAVTYDTKVTTKDNKLVLEASNYKVVVKESANLTYIKNRIKQAFKDNGVEVVLYYKSNL